MTGNPSRDGARFALPLAMALVVLSALPFVVSAFPQMTDYPSHLARYHVMLGRADSAFLQQYYDFEWILTGNLGADLLVWLLGKVMGVETAGWLVGFVIPPLTGLGLIAVEWQLRRRIGAGAMLAMATIWSPAMSMGFYNFCLALALALFAFALWVRMDGDSRRWLVFLPIGLVVWLCHAAGWGVLGVLVGGYEWSRRRNWRGLLAPWPLLVPVAAIVLSPAGEGSLNYGEHLGAYKTAIWLRGLRDQSLALDIASVLLIVAAAALALRFRRIDPRLGWAALGLAALTIALPRHFGGGDFADLRLVAVALMIAALAIDVALPRWLVALCAVPFVLRLALTTLAWHAQSAELATALRALDAVPQGARVAAAVRVDPGYWRIDPFEHAPSWATVRRDALTNSHFAVKGVHMLSVRGAGSDFVDPSQRLLLERGQGADLANFAPARGADFLWYFGREPPAALPAGAVVVSRTPVSLLARLAKPVDGS